MRGKWKIVAVICMILCGVLCWKPCAQKVYANQTAWVVTEGNALNLRQGVGTGTVSLALMPNGSQLVVLDTAAGSDNNGAWYKVEYNGLEGYVAAKYITFTANATPAPLASPSQTPAATQTASPEPAATQAPTSTKTTVTVYRTKTIYKKINIPAKLKKKLTVCKNTSGKALKQKRKEVDLKKNKSVRIIAEKTKGNTKWFQIRFTYNGKTRKGYIRSTDVRPILSQPAGGTVTGVKTALRVRKKPGSSNPYYKVNGRVMVLAKKQYIEILKVRTIDKRQWYRISYEYYGKTYTGYVQAKYIKLTKRKIQKKVAVPVLSEQEFEDEMTRQGFPDSYKDSLRKLHELYPYWQFTAFQTGLDWNNAVTGESKLGLNLISNSKAAAWKSMDPGAYDADTGKWKVFDGSSWVAASREAISYYMTK